MMNFVRRAVRVSKALDTRRSPTGEEPLGQVRVDRALTGGSGAPWVEPPGSLRVKILDALAHSRTTPIPLELPRRRPTPWGTLSAAAALLVLGAGGVIALRAMPEGGGRVPEAAAPAPRVSASAPARYAPPIEELASLPRRSESAVAATVEVPLAREVKRMRADAARAVDLVARRMPVGLD